MLFIKTLMTADQIYSFLLKLKLKLRIGPNSNYKKKHQLNAFTSSKKI